MPTTLQLLKYLDSFQELSEEERAELSEICRPLFLPKKTKLVETGNTFDHLFVLTNGLLRWSFDTDDGTENNIFFTSEKDHTIIIGIPEFYNDIKTTKYTIEAAVDTQLLLFPKDQFEELAFQHKGIYQLYIKSLKVVIDTLRKRIEQFCSDSPSSRYENLLESRPFIARNANLKHLATFLGITPNSLSRLTARLHSKIRSYKK